MATTNHAALERDCPTCSGTGRLWQRDECGQGYEVCWKCDGDRVVPIVECICGRSPVVALVDGTPACNACLDSLELGEAPTSPALECA